METGSILLYLSWGAFESVTQWALGLYITATVFFGLDMVLQSCTAFRNEAGIICDDSLKEVCGRGAVEGRAWSEVEAGFR